MWNLNGTITTPWFGEDFIQDYYTEDIDYCVILEVPENIQDLVGSSSLVVELEVDTRKDTDWVESAMMYTYHKTKKTWEEAESHCLKNGGHLASVTCEDENQMLLGLVGGRDLVWLGGKLELGDGRTTPLGSTPNG